MPLFDAEYLIHTIETVWGRDTHN